MSEEEKQKFIRWLDQLSVDNEALAVQTERINQPVMTFQLRNEADAARLIARRLRQTETHTL